MTKDLGWVQMDRQDATHVDHFKRLFRLILDQAVFSMVEVTDNDLTAPLALANTPIWFAVHNQDEGDKPAEVIGMIGFFKLNWVDQAAELIASVYPQFQSNGVGSDHIPTAIRIAKEKLGLRRLYLHVLDGAPGHKAAEKGGLVKEGTMRAARRYGSIFRDAHMYAWVEGD